MFLLPSLALGIVFAVLLGGRLARLLEVRLRLGWTVFLSLGVQAVVFSRLGASLDEATVDRLHLASYVLLIGFTLANLHVRTLVPVLLGLVLNALAIGVNGGRMPVSPSAADAAGIALGHRSSVSPGAEALAFLGDVFALPAQLPLANVFSVGDLLIGFGMAAFVVVTSLGSAGERTLSLGRLLEPLAVRDYRRLALGKLVSHTGDWLTLATLVGWVYRETGSTGGVAAVLLFRLVPPIIGGGLAAVVIDRLPKHRLIVGVEAARGLAVAAALGGVLTGQVPVVLGALAASGALAALSNAAVPALVPSLLPAEKLASANAGLGIAKDVAMALGAVGAGVALSVTGAAAALAIDLATFALAIVLFAGLRAAAPPAAGDEDGAPVAGRLRYVLGHRRILVLVLSFATATLATGLTNASLPRFLEDELGLGSGGYGFGMAALAGGLVLGEALVGVARAGESAGRWIGAGLLLMAGLFAVLALVVHPPTALLVLAGIGFVDGTTEVLFETVVQREAHPRYYGAVFGFASAFMAATMTSAFALAPLANELFAPSDLFVASGLLLVGAGGIALVGMRGARRAPEPEPEPEVAESRLHLPGEDLSVVVSPALVRHAELAAAALHGRVSVEIVVYEDLSRDGRAVLASVAKTSKVAVLHDGDAAAGAEAAATIGERAFHDLDAPVRRVSVDGDVVAALEDLAAF